jgi:hypothetical protein
MAWTNLFTGFSTPTDPAGGRDTAKYYAFDALGAASSLNALVGGVQTQTVTTSESYSSATFGDLTTTTDKITGTVGASGIVLLVANVNQVYVTGSGGAAVIGIDVSGANTEAASDRYSAGTSIVDINFTRLYTGLTAGSTVFKLKYKSTAGTATFSFSNRTISGIFFP